MFRIAIPVLFAALLAGCNTTLQIKKPDATTGMYATTTTLKAEEVRVEEKFDPAYKRMLYLKINADTPNPRFVEFFESAFKDMQTFDKVVTKSDLEKIIIDRDLGSKVPSVSDLVGLNSLSKEIGPFLIVEPNAIYKPGYASTARSRPLTPEPGKRCYRSKIRPSIWLASTIHCSTQC
ncbi:hypothetical protein [Cupriavidus gilardii]|uniref:hypothetical protein n=1 Tax=Cupriavidus gilardii TaxID=82541 RepID=UPI0021B4719E|nr:hypothetical protein [Cupriavidus gilardii]UXC38227.1 hypothetical protein N4G38_24515 [Cupriavidus gilardii]